ncbi:helicase-related protein [Methylobacterium sp. J-068]|uniref:helicase-related protein n=1 Tax=Methylobacterium sp. J-068 TaxID=2836649 RepID=UPI001FBBD74D|nr:helicase-related protein [Methylobacterium sp. J-068]MCJ2035652.1 DEAD/DEAH box helicase [Methylobacterium sp. J-068]
MAKRRTETPSEHATPTKARAPKTPASRTRLRAPSRRKTTAPKRAAAEPAPSPASPEIVAPLVPAGALAVALLGLTACGTPLVHTARESHRLESIAKILRALAPECRVALYPEWDCLPYDRASPSRGVMGARTGVLRWLTDTAALPDIVLTTAPALIQRVPPRETWGDAHLEIRVGDALDPPAITGALRRLGYILDDRVDEPGEVAVWGRTVDVFPAAADRPCRIEYEDGRVTAIRSYDPVSQRSLADAQVLVIDPATEIVLPEGSESRLEPFTGQEHGLARYYAGLTTFLDQVPDARLVVEDGAEERAQAFFEQIAEGREALARGRRGVPDDAGLYLTPEEWAALRDARRLASAEAGEDGDLAMPAFVRAARPNTALAETLRERLKAGDRVLLTGPAEPLARLVRAAERALGRKARPVGAWGEAVSAKSGALLSLEAPIEAGFRVPDQGIAVIAAADLFGARAATVAAGGPSAILPIGEVELRIGDVAVDRDNGLCVFEGLERVETGAGAGEDALRLRFAGDGILMVPVSQADRIWRYGSEVEAVTLDKLEGGKSEKGSWGRRRLEAEACMARAARVMLADAEKRRAIRAPVLVPPDREMERFAAGFGYALTADQASAVAGVMGDLASGRPMDRLVCGDVGFGKTEVALRAAAAALFAGRQVAIVAPTTVLARQHVQTFTRRFSRFGIEVAHLSRLVSPAEAKRVKAGLAEGSIRLVVGTHCLAQAGVSFADLGLMVIDEEQRFGAKVKQGLREAAGDGHVLTLTATPIPRTLQSALVGLQSLSVIATPPSVRQPIRTVIAPFEDEAMRDALNREHRRGGQSFIVCPRIEDIAPMAARLARLVPDLATLVAHGELKAAEMDDVMVRFADGEGDVLLATSIIESGLDVPRANTMLVWDAERFGLSQLHQLRGRVGRGQRRGVVYLLSRPDKPLTPATEKRLRTLEALDRLGAGFAISARDLDLRGAGDLVGENQAGHVKLIGLGLYQHLLHLALRAAKGEPAEDWNPEIRLGLSGAVPADYVPEPEVRLGLYTRTLRLTSAEEVEALRSEVVDRFGPPPAPFEDLIALARLRVACLALGIHRLSGGPQGLAADLRPNAPPLTVPAHAHIERRDNRVLLRQGSEDPATRGRLAAAFLERLRAQGARRTSP